MAWERDLFAVFDDLESQAESLWAQEREAELADRVHSEYAGVTLASRLMASLGASVVLDLAAGAGRVEGELSRVGPDWCLVSAATGEWIVPLAHVRLVHGASRRSVPEQAWSPVHRLGLRSALRRLVDAGDPVVVHLVGDLGLELVLRRVGSDFVDALTPAGEEVLLPYDAIVVVRDRDR